jgi:catechol 2,3-dioxygenase-like lactoylglutathione lyase family enzyme
MMAYFNRVLSIVLLGMLALSNVAAQAPERPALWGIAKMTYLVSDFQVARDYYGRFLGFDEAFTYPSELGDIISFKVNDRQFLEFIEDADARNKARLVSVSFETEDVEQMRAYLASKGVEVPGEVTIDGAGNEVILVHDDSDVPVEFIRYAENSLHKRSKGRYLSPDRISTRIQHAGLYNREVKDDPPFYAGILGFKEMFRYPEERTEKVFMTYYQIPECAEMIEHYPSKTVNSNHPCFLVQDMQETIYTLKERRVDEFFNSPKVGITRKWLLYLRNPDGTGVEFVEEGMVR